MRLLALQPMPEPVATIVVLVVILAVLVSVGRSLYRKARYGRSERTRPWAMVLAFVFAVLVVGMLLAIVHVAFVAAKT